MTQCQLTNSEKWHDFVSKDFYATTGSENRAEECLASAARQINHLRVQGVTQNAVLEDQGRVTKIQDLVHTLRTESVSVRNSKRLSNRWARSNDLHGQKFPGKYSVPPAPGIGQKDFENALAENG